MKTTYTSKICTKCKQELPLVSFGKKKNTKDGLRCQCKKCKAIESKEFRLNNKERLNEYSKTYRKNNKEKISKYQKEYQKEYARKNARKKREIIEEKLKSGLCYRCNNKRLLHSKSFCEEHWYKAKCNSNGISTKHWIKLRDIMKKQNYKCVYTGDELVLALNVELDHIVPVAVNYNLKSDIFNLQWVTEEANQTKFKYTTNEFFDMCLKVCKRFDLI